MCRGGGAEAALVVAHDRLHCVKQWVGSDTPELSLSENTTSPRETAEDQDSFCRSHVKVDEQSKKRARCELNIPRNLNSLSAVIAFDAP